MFIGLTLYAWITIAVILTAFTVLCLTELPTEWVFFGGMCTLYLTGVLSLKEAFSGMISSTVLTVGILFIVIAGLVYTGVLHWIVNNLMGTPKSYPRAIVRLMVPVAAISAFLSNTTVVALFVRIVKMWAGKLRIAPSKLLIPLSYASGMGGICTLIGTPPNLIISEMLEKDTGIHLGFFAPALPGLFCLTVGILSMLAMRRLLPERVPGGDNISEQDSYRVELRVPSNSRIVGMTIAESGLNRRKDVSLIGTISFDGQTTPASDEDVILGNDRLVFTGEVQSVMRLCRTYGLVSSDDNVSGTEKFAGRKEIRTGYVRRNGPLDGRIIDQTDIESSCGFTLLAVSRDGGSYDGSPRQLRLERGDKIMVVLDSGTKEESLSGMMRFFDSDDIPVSGRKTVFSTLVMTAFVALSAFNVLPLVDLCIIAAAVMIISRCCTFSQAASSIDWSILMIFAGSIAFGEAIQKTGISEALANGLMDICGTNPLVVLIALCTLGTFITELVSNTACAAIFYPIAYTTAISLNANPVTFCVALMIAVSSSFATPIGSPTHMLVYTPGGYRFTDFLKVGLPMNILMLAANILVTTLLFPL